MLSMNIPHSYFYKIKGLYMYLKKFYNNSKEYVRFQ